MTNTVKLWPDAEIKKEGFREELEKLLNRFSKENDSNTPDFLLANFMISCKDAFDLTVRRREEWYGR